MHTGYTLIQPYVFLTLNSLLTNEHLLSSPADLFCYEFSGDVSLKFVASPYTELIIGQRPDGSCRIFCIRTAENSPDFHTALVCGLMKVCITGFRDIRFLFRLTCSRPFPCLILISFQVRFLFPSGYSVFFPH